MIYDLATGKELFKDEKGTGMVGDYGKVQLANGRLYGFRGVRDLDIEAGCSKRVMRGPCAIDLGGRRPRWPQGYMWFAVVDGRMLVHYGYRIACWDLRKEPAKK
jgi:hypothetical protein